VTQRKTPDWAGATPLFGGQSAQKFCPGRSRPLLHSGAHVFSPRAKHHRTWPSNSQVPVKWASPPYFTATSPATSPSIEHGITEINQMNRPEERNCARPRPRLRRERPHPLTHGASPVFCGVAPAFTRTSCQRFIRLHTQTREFVRQEVGQFARKRKEKPVVYIEVTTKTAQSSHHPSACRRIGKESARALC